MSVYFNQSISINSGICQSIDQSIDLINHLSFQLRPEQSQHSSFHCNPSSYIHRPATRAVATSFVPSDPSCRFLSFWPELSQSIPSSFPSDPSRHSSSIIQKWPEQSLSINHIEATRAVTVYHLFRVTRAVTSYCLSSFQSDPSSHLSIVHLFRVTRVVTTFSISRKYPESIFVCDPSCRTVSVLSVYIRLRPELSHRFSSIRLHLFPTRVVASFQLYQSTFCLRFLLHERRIHRWRRHFGYRGSINSLISSNVGTFTNLQR